jgi:hypothetical protein
MLLVIRDRIDNGAAQHVEGVVFGVVDLQGPKSLSDVVADWTQKYPAIANAIAGLPAQDAYLDGEL